MRWPVFLLSFALLGPQAAPRGLDDGVFVYDVFRGRASCDEALRTLRSLPLRETIILSVEEGADFVLDRGAAAAACVAAGMRAAGHRVKLMVLQDASFLERPDEARRRVRAVAALAAAHPDTVDGVVIDLEPYTDERWDCADEAERRRIGERFRDLVAQLRRESAGLPLEAVVPWWFGAEPAYPALTLSALSDVADGLILMLYGDEGGPVVYRDRGEAARRMEIVMRTSPPRQRFSIGLATFERGSPAALDDELAEVRRRYGTTPHFAGTAVFHAAGRFGARLVRMVQGRVTDEAGAGLAGVRVTVDSQAAETNACGRFVIRDVGPAEAMLRVGKAGFRDVERRLQLREPGLVTELAPIVLAAARELPRQH